MEPRKSHLEPLWLLLEPLKGQVSMGQSQEGAVGLLTASIWSPLAGLRSRRMARLLHPTGRPRRGLPGRSRPLLFSIKTEVPTNMEPTSNDAQQTRWKGS